MKDQKMKDVSNDTSVPVRRESHAASELVHAPMLPGTLVRAPTSHPNADDMLVAASQPYRRRPLLHAFPR